MSQRASSSLDPLPEEVHNGMIAMGMIGLASTLSTLSLLIFITYRMIYWRRFYEHSIAKNQIFILIYNLLLADFQQALSFLIAFYWLSQNKLVGPSSVCFAQGWLIQIGDLSSGIWVLAIATHTFVGLVLQRQIPFRAFIVGVLGIWLFCLVLTAIGPILHGKEYFVPAGVWCWIGEGHERDRLTFHYLWIFVSQLGSLVLYGAIFLFLRIRLSTSILANSNSGVGSEGSQIAPTTPGQQKFPTSTVGTTTTVVSNAPRDGFTISRQRILRTARYMVVYPFAYVTLTLPLAAGRVSSMAGRTPPLIFFCIAGAMMASCGFLDVALYIYTRKALVRSSIGLKRHPTNTHADSNPLSPYPRTDDNRRDTWHDGEGTAWHEDTESGNSGRPSHESGSLGSEQKTRVENGAIVVSKSVTMSEDNIGGTRTNLRVQKSESVRSLVGGDRRFWGGSIG
ncbi:G protein-coupled glucose receptor regulating Gpa2-domain-containing protein [Amylocarpus encephaloides]|uniref:G protein-coupled glucose receptor regulating Gpa2-domain-containing protein n=1 Tax=Amylocarpus encephaloides TaxID=45428 RepID=A0A9P8C8U1_9HELO|nr:G protein-coupled glucose receptor regulating Gpa2-domain-containing protein [Amylocarpus encephaloides]